MQGNDSLSKIQRRPLKEPTAHLAAAHRCPFLWSTAKCSERLLEGIAEAYEVLREEMAVLVMSPDTPNIYQQRRVIKSAISIG